MQDELNLNELIAKHSTTVAAVKERADAELKAAREERAVQGLIEATKLVDEEVGRQVKILQSLRTQAKECKKVLDALNGVFDTGEPSGVDNLCKVNPVFGERVADILRNHGVSV